jgi:DNA mismatch repair protein MutL
VKFDQVTSDHPKIDAKPSLTGLDAGIAGTMAIKVIQAQNRFIIKSLKSGIAVIDQQNAHERILYERFLALTPDATSESQMQLLPVTINLNQADAEFFNEIREEFTKAGFVIDNFGKNTLIITAIPADCKNHDIHGLFEQILESLKTHPGNPNTNRHVLFVQSLAKSLAIRRGVKLQPEEMNGLLEGLFSCKVPDMTPEGKPVMMIISYEELIKKFK